MEAGIRATIEFLLPEGVTSPFKLTSALYADIHKQQFVLYN